MHDIISDLSKRYWQEREAQIVNRLAKAGYIFDSKDALYAFIKEHMTLVKYQERPNYQEILLDGKLFAWWETELDLNFDHNTHTYKATFK